MYCISLNWTIRANGFIGYKFSIWYRMNTPAWNIMTKEILLIAMNLYHIDITKGIKPWTGILLCEKKTLLRKHLYKLVGFDVVNVLFYSSVCCYWYLISWHSMKTSVCLKVAFHPGDYGESVNVMNSWFDIWWQILSYHIFHVVLY